MNNIFPWQQTVWENLWQRQQQNRLPHALLFSGLQGLGKKQLAKNFAEALLCAHVEKGIACGVCHSCCLNKSSTHPDMLIIEPEEDGQIIKAEQIRQAVNFVNSTALLSGYRVIIIDPVAAMNSYAANGLLKILEEPTDNTLFILISAEGLPILPTIKSRCQQIAFSKPSTNEAITWLKVQFPNLSDSDMLWVLKFTEGAPLEAQKLINDNILSVSKELYRALIDLSSGKLDPVLLAVNWQEVSLDRLLKLIFVWLQDILYLQKSNQSMCILNNDYTEHLKKCQNKISTSSLIHYLDYVQVIFRKLRQSLNLNHTLVLESLFIRWVKICS